MRKMATWIYPHLRPWYPQDFDGHLDLSWPPGSIHLDLSTWIYPPGSIHLDLSTWIYPPGSIHLDLSTWIYPPGSIHLDLATWIWPPGSILATWINPRLRPWYPQDFEIIQRRVLRVMLVTKASHYAHGWTDHRRSTL
ncbi:unnamed protein product [Schistocephalus solidus]|uniref:Proline-rich protein 2-like n=1 Tax=Schistocephalus solidus TaxID=70667 RepID=A0A183T7M2_SCHSO|nr:unnamed protein product [Schistocephalus solidus]